MNYPLICHLLSSGFVAQFIVSAVVVCFGIQVFVTSGVHNNSERSNIQPFSVSGVIQVHVINPEGLRISSLDIVPR